jgi:hypothetical protein
MAAPNNPRGGRKKRVEGEPTRPYPVNATERERARWDALAKLRSVAGPKKVFAADIMRDFINAECDRAGIPFDPRPSTDAES